MSARIYFQGLKLIFNLQTCQLTCKWYQLIKQKRFFTTKFDVKSWLQSSDRKIYQKLQQSLAFNPRTVPSFLSFRKQRQKVKIWVRRIRNTPQNRRKTHTFSACHPQHSEPPSDGGGKGGGSVCSCHPLVTAEISNLQAVVTMNWTNRCLKKDHSWVWKKNCFILEKVGIYFLILELI